jgi:hypothetical protein
VSLELEGSHSGSFAAIKNQDGIPALQSKYGLRIVDINNNNCVYTSTFKSSSGVSGSSSSNNNESTQNNSHDTQNITPDNMDRSKCYIDLNDTSKWGSGNSWLASDQEMLDRLKQGLDNIR